MILKTNIKVAKKILMAAMKMKPYASVMIFGRAGIGKSTLINSLKSENIEVFDVRAVMMDIGDLSLKVPDIKNKTLLNIYNDIFLKIIETAKEKDVILLLDEFTQATIPVLRMFYQIILDRRLENLKFPDNVQITAISNLQEDCEITDISSEKPLWDRFMFRLEISPSLEEWTKWAINNNFDKRIISFLTFKKEYFYYENEEMLITTPRRWEYLQHSILQNPNLDNDIVESILGEEVGASFEAFCNVTGRFNIKQLIESDLSKLKEDEKYMVIPMLSYEIAKIYVSKNVSKVNQILERFSSNLISEQKLLLMKFIVSDVCFIEKKDRLIIAQELSTEIKLFNNYLSEIVEKTHGNN